MSHAAKGETVIGATPTPAETSETASARCVSNHPVTVAISGAKKAPAAMPTSTPNPNWNASGEVARLATSRPAPSSTAPLSTTMRAPTRSLTVPHAKPATPMTRKSSVIAVEIVARPQPVLVDSGPRNTASENIAPIATHVVSAPTATMTQRYPVFMRLPPSDPAARRIVELHAAREVLRSYRRMKVVRRIAAEGGDPACTQAQVPLPRRGFFPPCRCWPRRSLDGCHDRPPGVYARHSLYGRRS